MPFTLRPHRRFPVRCAVVLLIVCLAAPAWAGFQAGMDASNRGDYVTALREWRPLAEQEDEQAQALLGLLYDTGRGVPQDAVQARHWFEKSTIQGDAKAQTNLGLLHYNGQGVPPDYVQAHKW